MLLKIHTQLHSISSWRGNQPSTIYIHILWQMWLSWSHKIHRDCNALVFTSNTMSGKYFLTLTLCGHHNICILKTNILDKVCFQNTLGWCFKPTVCKLVMANVKPYTKPSMQPCWRKFNCFWYLWGKSHWDNLLTGLHYISYLSNMWPLQNKKCQWQI